MTTIIEAYQSTDNTEALILRVDRIDARWLEIALKEFAESKATDMPCCAADAKRMADDIFRHIVG